MREPGQDDENEISMEATEIRWDITALRAQLPPKRASLRCCCCGEFYSRGSFRCCAAPAGMNAGRWLELACPMPSEGGCGKCWRHCACQNKSERAPKGPLADLAAEFTARIGNRR